MFETWGQAPVTTTPNKLKRPFLLILMALLFAAAIIGIFYGHNNFPVRAIGILALFACLSVARGLRSPPLSAYVSPQAQERQEALALKPWHWFVGLVLIGLVAATLVWLYDEATTGGKSATPVYAFAAATLLCGGWWAALHARWMGG